MRTPGCISLIVLCLAVLAPSAARANDDTASLWQHRCSKCHGEDGRGDTKTGRKLYINDLADPIIQSKFTDVDAANSIKVGLKDAKGKTVMKAIDGLSDEEIKSLVAYVRSLKR